MRNATSALKSVVKRMPPFRGLLAEIAQLREQARGAYPEFVPPGHYYSAVRSLDDVRKDSARIFAPPQKEILGVDMNEPGQIEVLQEIAALYADLPFGDSKQPGLRYYYENPSYSYSDAIFLYGMIRRLRPERIIEVGSGFSTCVMLDTNERFLDNRAQVTLIEPYPDLVKSLMDDRADAGVTLIPSRVQDAPLELYEELQAGDILFIDSTHVGKVGSDVNWIFFEILPRLRPGVYVHFHDIFFPFEYPKPWILEGRCWNEAYMLRAFLQFNSAFKVVVANTFLAIFHRELLFEKMPLCARNTGGSIWLKREA